MQVCGCVFFSSLITRSDSRVPAAGAAERKSDSQRVAPPAISGSVRGRRPPGWYPGRLLLAWCRRDALSSSGSPTVAQDGGASCR